MTSAAPTAESMIRYFSESQNHSQETDFLSELSSVICPLLFTELGIVIQVHCLIALFSVYPDHSGDVTFKNISWSKFQNQ